MREERRDAAIEAQSGAHHARLVCPESIVANRPESSTVDTHLQNAASMRRGPFAQRFDSDARAIWLAVDQQKAGAETVKTRSRDLT